MSLAPEKNAPQPATYKTVGRIVHIYPSSESIAQFLDKVKHISIDDLRKIPFKRTICSRELLTVLGAEFGESVVSTIKDYQSGCVVVHFGVHDDQDDYVKISTAVSHLLSRPIPEPSGEYFGVTTVVHADDPAIKILDPYRVFTMHTDGVFADNPVDWQMMMKVEEENASGGESRLLHIGDFAEFDDLRKLPAGDSLFCFGLEEKDSRYEVLSKGSSMEKLHAPILAERDGRRSIKFIDQFIIVESIDQATFVEAVQDALEHSEGIVQEPLPVGSMMIIDNTVWLHGRGAFERNEGLRRSLLRQYGYFPERHPAMKR